MDYKELFKNIKKKQSFLCIGLDSDITKIPTHLLQEDDPVFLFNKLLINATHDLVVAYKPNIAFYESRGVVGWESLKKTVDYIRKNFPDIFLIADAKRGDIGNTSKMYAQTFFEVYDFDAITVSPYMGKDSILPFLSYPNKYVIILALTSNEGAANFQLFSNGQPPLYQEVITQTQQWGDTNRIMYVVGATQAEMFSEIRKLAPQHFLLVPGVGEQGGSLEQVVTHGMNNNCGLLVNSSRAIIFADKTHHFDKMARIKALSIRDEMKQLLIKNNLIPI